MTTNNGSNGVQGNGTSNGNVITFKAADVQRVHGGSWFDLLDADAEVQTTLRRKTVGADGIETTETFRFTGSGAADMVSMILDAIVSEEKKLSGKTKNGDITISRSTDAPWRLAVDLILTAHGRPLCTDDEVIAYAALADQRMTARKLVQSETRDKRAALEARRAALRAPVQPAADEVQPVQRGDLNATPAAPTAADSTTPDDSTPKGRKASKASA
jgi:hypothetical protein